MALSCACVGLMKKGRADGASHRLGGMPDLCPEAREGGSMTTVMPFGKHRGERIDRLDRGYLRWLLSCDNLTPWLAAEVRRELGRRGERYVDAGLVLGEIEQALESAVATDDRIDHDQAGLLLDHVLDVFEHVRTWHGIGQGTELVVAGRREGGEA